MLIRQAPKIKYCGPFGENSGYAEANRNYIRALHEAGVKVTTENVMYAAQIVDPSESLELARKLEANPMAYDIKVIHTPADGYLKHMEPTKYHIGHLFWETDRMSKSWVWNCNLVNEIWTGGEYHKQAFIKAGVNVPVFTFPQPVQVNHHNVKPFIVANHKGYLFYSIFQWIERKNPRALLRAYWQEFEGRDDVSLLLKVYRMGFDSKERMAIKEDILKWKRELGMEKTPRVLLCLDLFSEHDIMRLHQTGHCFVSAHRGEGWGIPQAEAISHARPVISTDLGGIHEYLKDNETALLVKWKYTHVKNMEFAPWYGTDHIWAEVDEDDLRFRMRWAFNNPDKAAKMGAKAAEYATRNLSYSAVGSLLKERLYDIQKKI